MVIYDFIKHCPERYAVDFGSCLSENVNIRQVLSVVFKHSNHIFAFIYYTNQKNAHQKADIESNSLGERNSWRLYITFIFYLCLWNVHYNANKNLQRKWQRNSFHSHFLQTKQWCRVIEKIIFLMLGLSNRTFETTFRKSQILILLYQWTL